MRRIPFTELVEQAANRARAVQADDSHMSILGGYCNDAYDELADEVPYLHEGLREDNNITLLADYTTGTVAITQGSTTVTGTGTTFTTAMTGRKFKVDGDDEVYTITFVSATEVTLDRAFIGTTVTAATFIIWAYRYLLAAGVANDPKFRVWRESNGVPVELTRAIDDQWEEGDLSVQPGIPTKYRLFGQNTSGLLYLEINKPDDDGRTLFYNSHVHLTHLFEYITGTATATRDQLSVIGVGTRWSTPGEITAGMWFRFDDDGEGELSKWYEIASVTNDTGIVLTTPYRGTTKSSASYTICNASKLPRGLDKAIIQYTAGLAVGDQNNGRQAKAFFDVYNVMLKKNFKKVTRRKPKRIKTVYEKTGVRR